MCSLRPALSPARVGPAAGFGRAATFPPQERDRRAAPPPFATPMKTTKHPYVLTPAGRASPGALAARRANIAKATAARRAADLRGRVALTALKHGLYAKRAPGCIGRLGEDPAEFDAHCQIFAQEFVPEDDAEREIVRRLAEAVWQRLRLLHAQAHWEAKRLRQLFAEAPRAARLTAEETERRACALAHALNDFQDFFDEASRFEAKIERELRRLLRKRSGGAISFQLLCPRRDPDLDGPDDEMSVEELLEGMKRLGAKGNDEL